MGLALTTVDRVKSLIRETGSGQDANLTLLITAISAQFEAYTQRNVLKQQYVEVYPLMRGRRLITLNASPVDMMQAFQVVLTIDNDFSDASLAPLQRSFHYIIEDDIGLLRFLTDPTPMTMGITGRPAAPVYVKVTYTGGMAADTAAFVAAFPAVSTAVELQVAHLFKRGLSPGGDLKVGNSQATYTKDYDILDAVQRIWNLYRRREMP